VKSCAILYCCCFDASAIGLTGETADVSAKVDAILAAPGARSSYWQLSRTPRYSVTMALPLFVLYEGLAGALSDPSGSGVRNGADVILEELTRALVGPRGPLVLVGLVSVAGVWLVFRDLQRNRGRLRPAIFVVMLAESIALASVFGAVVGLVTTRVVATLGSLAIAPVGQLSVATRLMVSLGAGLFEELLFRVLLVSALVSGARLLLGVGRALANVCAVVLAALIFSAFHYIGPLGDAFRIDSFVFRALSGLTFSALYVTRGFGITAWTHALYDIFLLAVS